MNVRIVPPRGDVQGCDHVGITGIPALQALKPGPVAVVLVDKATCRIRTGLTGVRGIDRHKAGTSRLGPELETLAQGRTHPAGHDPVKPSALRSTPQMREIFDHDD
jgi:hypothetical protein